MRTKSNNIADTNTRKFLILSAALVLLSAVLMYGCSSDQSATAPETMSAAHDSRGAAMGRVPAAAPSLITSKTIDRESGGFVRLDGVNLLIPPNSLEKDTEITIVKHPGEPDRVLFDLLPHGIEFEKPVTLVVNLRETDLGPRDDVTIYWFDPRTETWIDLKAQGKYPQVWVFLEHFSKYGSGRAGW